MPERDGTRLRIAPHRESWRIWDGTVVFFEPFSGNTHRINPPSGYILKLLAESESSRTDIDCALGQLATPEEINEALNVLLTMELLEPA